MPDNPSQSQQGPAPYENTEPNQIPDPEDPKEIFDIEQAKLDKHIKATAGLKEEFTASEAADKEEAKALAGYEQALPALEKKVKDANEYLQTKEPMANAAVGENKGAIDAVINGYDDDLEKREEIRKQLEEEKSTAKVNYDAAVEELKEARSKFDEAKNYLVDVTADMARFQSLVPQIEGYDPGMPATMYLLTQEARRATPKKVYTIDDLRKKLSDAIQALKESMSGAREAKDVWEGAIIDYEQTQTTLLARRASQHERLSKKIAKYNVPPPPQSLKTT